MTNNKIIKILWVDDERKYRTEEAKSIEHKRKGLRIEALHPQEEKMKERLLEIKNKKNIPDIFLIDYFLDRVPERPKGERYDARALTLAGRVRELLPEYPIYVITNFSKEPEGICISEAQAAKATFDKILMFKDVQRQGHDTLYYDALDFRKIRESPRENMNVLFELLHAPDDIKERIEFVLPNELKNGLSSPDSSEHPAGNAISFARWTQNPFLSVPGFVYNKLYAATYLGMNIKSFEKISPKLKRARYIGIFSRTFEEAWWASKLSNLIFSYKKAQKSKKTNPWAIAPVIFNIPKNGLSRCIVCNRFLPETVGRNMDDYKELKPVHYRCSKPDYKKERIPYFEEYRVFEKKQ